MELSCGDQLSQLQDYSLSNKGIDGSALIHYVFQCKCLWDQSSDDYKKTVSKQDSWEKISRKMNVSIEDCIKKWHNLRENYRKEKRKRLNESKSGSGIVKRKGFPYYNEMKFLENCSKETETFSNAASAPLSTDNTNDNSIQNFVISFDPMEEEREYDEPSHLDDTDGQIIPEFTSDLSAPATTVASIPSPWVRKRKNAEESDSPKSCYSGGKDFVRRKMSSDEPLLKSVSQLTDALLSTYQNTSASAPASAPASVPVSAPPEDNAIDYKDKLFGETVARELSQMDPETKKIAKRRISEILYS